MKKIWKVAISSISMSVLFAPVALADQCAYITRPQAVAAFSNLNVGQTIYELCEPCGERTPKPVVIKSLSVGNNSSGFWEVTVNGRGIDLAYTYIEYRDRDNAKRRVNLALVSSCPARGFTPVI